MGVEDLDDRINRGNWKDSPALAGFLAHSPDEIFRETQLALSEGRVPNQGHDPAQHYVWNANGLLTSLQSKDMEQIPEPYLGQTRQAREWLAKHSTNLLVLLIKIAREKAKFVHEHSPSGLDKSPNTRTRWAALESVHSLWLHDYKVHFRILQEDLLVKTFLLSATPEEKSRYLKLVACESRPLL